MRLARQVGQSTVTSVCEYVRGRRLLVKSQQLTPGARAQSGGAGARAPAAGSTMFLEIDWQDMRATQLGPTCGPGRLIVAASGPSAVWPGLGARLILRPNWQPAPCTRATSVKRALNKVRELVAKLDPLNCSQAARARFPARQRPTGGPNVSNQTSSIIAIGTRDRLKSKLTARG